MRYSMLVYLTKMSRTLLEAAEYLLSAPKEGPVRAELLKHGQQMIVQIRTELERHAKDLHSNRVLDSLAAIEQLWGTDGTELLELLESFVQCLPGEIHYRVRAVFFTGLGSTWDAMESVYTYMRDDPRFDPVVVLIPILRQIEKEGQTNQEVTYEDYLTPLGIPFLAYTQYSLEEDCPDLAFTNQPYEGTTITEFWPVTISKYTRLVYLPYYLPDVVVGTTLNSLCKAPIYRYAWRVACPNQKEYQYYCRNAANGGANGILEGIPKLDHLVSLPKRGSPLPKGWECLKGKKVFLWNSWYIIKFSSIQWFEEIIPWFIEHDDCALIWRPHPMTDTVTKLYHAKQYPNYQKYIQQIRSMPNAILDQDISYEAAFYYSDALISDASSLLPQYLLMDKPAVWFKNDIWRFTGEEFIDSQWTKQTKTPDGILTFLEQIREGQDPKAELRKIIRERDLPLADGHAGERLCNVLLQELYKEDFSLF